MSRPFLSTDFTSKINKNISNIKMAFLLNKKNATLLIGLKLEKIGLLLDKFLTDLNRPNTGHPTPNKG